MFHVLKQRQNFYIQVKNALAHCQYFWCCICVRPSVANTWVRYRCKWEPDTSNIKIVLRIPYVWSWGDRIPHKKGFFKSFRKISGLVCVDGFRENFACFEQIWYTSFTMHKTVLGFSDQAENGCRKLNDTIVDEAFQYLAHNRSVRLAYTCFISACYPLKIGLTFDCFHRTGTIPAAIDCWISGLSALQMLTCTSSERVDAFCRPLWICSRPDCLDSISELDSISD